MGGCYSPALRLEARAATDWSREGWRQSLRPPAEWRGARPPSRQCGLRSQSSPRQNPVFSMRDRVHSVRWLSRSETPRNWGDDVEGRMVFSLDVGAVREAALRRTFIPCGGGTIVRIGAMPRFSFLERRISPAGAAPPDDPRPQPSPIPNLLASETVSP